jgi:hypothetical protein
MSKKASLIEKAAEQIYREFQATFRFGLDNTQQEMFKLYLITRLTMVYNEGYGDGLEMARNIFMTETDRKER